VASCVRLRDLDPEIQRHRRLEEEALALCQSAVKYRVLGRAGAGAFGVVFKVRTSRSGRMELQLQTHVSDPVVSSEAAPLPYAVARSRAHRPVIQTPGVCTR
jgi:hypothetical protein